MAVFQQLQEKELKRGRLMTEPDGPAAHAWVKRVSDRVIWASGLGDKYRWEYILINAPGTANAIAFPGGRIIVFTGILPVARDDAGLATIIGHVVGHVMGHHMAERISKEFVMGFAEEIAREQGASDSTIATMRLVNRSILSQYSRIHETEADLIGLLLMSKAGYDPRESVKLWQRMNDAAGEFSRGHEFLHTHPGSGTQIADLQAWMQQALQYYENPSLALPVLK
ncbi:MAG: M48 family metallopeptidase [Candidatus Tectomicrobia bacterium]|uniref:M48 family metallopeptidase n=1 Tax=Tectimicrobiota bacterium TaxID=2528274 RepID=A0A932GSE5_UNCTE|nr:M48 family metallopeptidase [Candidatus Tectomicrobia bacterium]